MASLSFIALHASGSVNKPFISPDFDHFKNPFSSSAKPFFKKLQQLPLSKDISTAIKKTSQRILDAFVDSVFEFGGQTTNPLQSNFAPVEEIGEAVEIEIIEGEIPNDFPEGIHIRVGSNPLFGALQSTVSMFGRSSNLWVEGEGMLHAVYLKKNTQGIGLSPTRTDTLNQRLTRLRKREIDPVSFLQLKEILHLF